MARAKTPLLQGTLDLIVLQLLQAEPTNGYDLSLRIQAISRDVLQVNAGSVYPALYRLEERGLIKAKWEETPSGRRAKDEVDRQLAALGIDCARRAETLDVRDHLRLCEVFG